MASHLSHGNNNAITTHNDDTDSTSVYDFEIFLKVL